MVKIKYKLLAFSHPFTHQKTKTDHQKYFLGPSSSPKFLKIIDSASVNLTIF